MRVKRTLLIVAAGCLFASAPGAALAQPLARSADTPAPIGPEEHTRRLKSAQMNLDGSDPAAIQSAFANLKELQGRAAAELVIARLKQGLPPQLIESALDVLSGLNQPLAVPVLSELTLHRRWQIREQAVRALAQLKVRSSVSVLLYALDDPSPEVRSTAARGLGLVGDPRARVALNAALERGVEGALEGLAQLATSAQVDAILARAKTNLARGEPALWVLLARPNLPAVTKLKVIAFLQNHDSEQEAEQLLARFRERVKHEGDPRLLPALASRPVTLAKPAAAAPPADTKLVATQGGAR